MIFWMKVLCCNTAKTAPVSEYGIDRNREWGIKDIKRRVEVIKLISFLYIPGKILF